MKLKNSSLERKRPLLFTAGLMFAVSLALVSFEWRVPYVAMAVEKPDAPDKGYEYETPPITLREPDQPKEQPEPPQPQEQSTDFDVVDNEIEVDAEPDELIFNEDDFIEVDDNFTVAEEPEVEEETIFKIVEDMPLYPGGDAALLGYLAKNLEYPRMAIENNITGTVYVTYVVDKHGNVGDVEVARGVHPVLDKEAVRVVKTLKGYKAGKQRGKPVQVQFTVPIHFVLK